MLSFLIVDDHDIVRQGICHLISQAFPGAAVTEAHSGVEALKFLQAATIGSPLESGTSYDVMVLDISLPGRSGLEILKDVQDRWPTLPVLVMSGHGEKQYAMRVLKLGARGYLSKDNARQELVQALQQILQGGRYVTETLSNQMADHLSRQQTGQDDRTEHLPHESLTDREHQVLCLLAAGKRVGEIADEMTLSVSAISTYRTRVMKKLQINSTAEMMLYAIKHGLHI